MVSERVINNTLDFAYQHSSLDTEQFPFDRQWRVSFWVNFLDLLLKDTPESLPLYKRRVLAVKVFKRLKPHVLRRRGLWQGIYCCLLEESRAETQDKLAKLRREAEPFYLDLLIGTREERTIKSLNMLRRFQAQWLRNCQDPDELM